MAHLPPPSLARLWLLLIAVAVLCAHSNAHAQGAPGGGGGGTATGSAGGGSSGSSGGRFRATLTPLNSGTVTSKPYGETAGGSLSGLVTDPGSLVRLNPNNIRLQTAVDAKVHFIGDSVGYTPTLGFHSYAPVTDAKSDLTLIYPDNSIALPPDTSYTSLGTLAAGSRLEFFLLAEGVQNSSAPNWWEQDVNNIAQVVYYAQPNSPYLLLGYQNTAPGGTDMLFAVNIGASNITALLGAPEPTLMATMAGLVGIVFFKRRRRIAHC